MNTAYCNFLLNFADYIIYAVYCPLFFYNTDFTFVFCLQYLFHILGLLISLHLFGFTYWSLHNPEIDTPYWTQLTYHGDYSAFYQNRNVSSSYTFCKYSSEGNITWTFFF